LDAAVAAPIEYAPGQHRRPWWRRRWVWGALAGAVVLALAAGGYRYRKPLRAKWGQLAFERQCLNYRVPADLVIYTDDPRQFPALLAATPQPAGGHYRESGNSEFVNFYPDVWMRHPLLKWDPGPAFLHGRTNPRGERRLVGVDLSPIDEEFWLYPRVVVPAGLTTDPRPAKTHAEYATLPADRQRLLALALVKDSRKDAVRVFAGQPDPDDPTHFTIRLEVNGVPETVDGWLQDDETVLLKPRDRATYLDSTRDATMWQAAGSGGAGRSAK
jgi:hypothetical protein